MHGKRDGEDSLELAQKRGESVGAELGRVKCGRGQTSEGFGDFLGRNQADLGGCLAPQQIGEDGTRSDRDDAALRLEARSSDSPAFEPHGKAQHVAADRIRHLGCSGGIGKVPGVVGIAKVVENGVVEHRR